MPQCLSLLCLPIIVGTILVMLFSTIFMVSLRGPVKKMHPSYLFCFCHFAFQYLLLHYCPLYLTAACYLLSIQIRNHLVELTSVPIFDVRLIKDKVTGISRGFCFIELGSIEVYFSIINGNVLYVLHLSFLQRLISWWLHSIDWLLVCFCHDNQSQLN